MVLTYCSLLWRHFDGLVQDCSNSSTLAKKLLLSCTKSSIWRHRPGSILDHIITVPILESTQMLSDISPCHYSINLYLEKVVTITNITFLKGRRGDMHLQIGVSSSSMYLPRYSMKWHILIYFDKIFTLVLQRFHLVTMTIWQIMENSWLIYVQYIYIHIWWLGFKCKFACSSTVTVNFLK